MAVFTSTEKILSTIGHEPRIKKNLHGFVHVAKGRSYTEPISGRPPPLVLHQGINGLVGKNNDFYGDIEGLKKRGLLMPSAENVVQSQHFVRVYKDLDWKDQDEQEKIHIKSEIQLADEARSGSRKVIFQYINPRLYPDQSTLMNRRKQGQCYSLMMEAKCQEQLFNAEISRAKQVNTTKAFIRKQHESRLMKNSLKYKDFELKDELLLGMVKNYINEIKSISSISMEQRDDLSTI